MNVSVDELMRVVRHCTAEFVSHPEYEDIYSEALIHAWRQVDRQSEDGQCRWTTIAGRAAFWQAREYLRQRRSGRITTQREQDTRPLRLDLIAERDVPTDDGGIAAADARLQLWLLGVDLTPRQRSIVRQIHWYGRSMNEAAQVLGIAANTARESYEAALKKYRQAGGLTVSAPERRCKQCRQSLMDLNPRRRFCSTRCKGRYQDYRRPSRSQRYAAREQQL